MKGKILIIYFQKINEVCTFRDITASWRSLTLQKDWN